MSYNKNIISLRAFLNKTNIAIINLIKLSNLQHTEDWRLWVDDFGNKLEITNDKNFVIKLNPNQDNQLLNSKDLYFKSHIKDIAKYSEFALIAIYNESYCIWLLDNNNILRFYLYVDNIFIGAQPILLSSVDTLKKIIWNLNVENFREVFHITEPTSKEKLHNAWVTKLPMDDRLLTLLPEVIRKDLTFNAER